MKLILLYISPIKEPGHAIHQRYSGCGLTRRPTTSITNLEGHKLNT